MPQPFISEIAHGSAAYKETVALRDRVLRAQLGLRFTDVELERERSAYHLACQREGEIVGCLILAPIDAAEVKLRQVAVTPRFRGRGLGRALTTFVEDFARERAFRMITLHPRATAVPFYENLGYERIGAPFEELAIPHWRMRKPL